MCCGRSMSYPDVFRHRVGKVGTVLAVSEFFWRVGNLRGANETWCPTIEKEYMPKVVESRYQAHQVT